MAFIAVCLVSLSFWFIILMISGVAEPWDMDAYWTVIYPSALVLSLLMGVVLKKAQWSAGVILIFAQMPIIVMLTGARAMLIAGVIYIAFLALPAAALSWIGGKLRCG